MKNKTYKFEIEGKSISVTAVEVRAYYGEHYPLTEKEISEYAAKYIARIKLYKQCNRTLDKDLVQRLLQEEKLMKEGESGSFKLQLTHQWYVEIEKETTDYFNYILHAYCLDIGQTFNRRYKSLESAILHCLNAFNENVSIPDKFKSLADYLTESVFSFSRYKILKTFAQGETIKFMVESKNREETFIRVSQTHLIIKNSEGQQEEINLDKIDKITL